MTEFEDLRVQAEAQSFLAKNYEDRNRRLRTGSGGGWGLASQLWGATGRTGSISHRTLRGARPVIWIEPLSTRKTLARCRVVVAARVPYRTSRAPSEETTPS